MASRFRMTICMIPSICKSTEIKSFAKVTEKMNRMWIQASPLPDHYFIHRSRLPHLPPFPLKCWLATEKPFKDPKVCAAHTILPQTIPPPPGRCKPVYGEQIVPQQPIPSARILATKEVRMLCRGASCAKRVNDAWFACLTVFAAKLRVRCHHGDQGSCNCISNFP